LAEADMVDQRQQLRLDRRGQRRVVAIWEVGSPDRSAKQHVGDQRGALRPVEKDDRTRRMSGAMENFEGVAGDRYPVALFQPAVGRYVAHAVDPVNLVLLLQVIEENDVVFVRSLYFDPELFAQFVGAAGMIDMSVGQQYFLDRDSGLFGGFPHALRGAAPV